MKTIIYVGALAGLISTAIVSAPTVANAQGQMVGPEEQYCVATGGAMRCEWATMEQCKKAFSAGTGGSDCMLNPKLSQQQKMKQ
jgi:hypothetical protein